MCIKYQFSCGFSRVGACSPRTRARDAHMLRLCFGPNKTDVSCTSELSSVDTRTTKNRTKFALQAFQQAIAQRTCEKLAPSALRGVLGASRGLPGASQDVLGASRERPGSAPRVSKAALGAFWARPWEPLLRQDRAKSDFARFLLDFCSILASPGPPWDVHGASWERFWRVLRVQGSHVHGSVFLFVRSFICSFVRSFVCSLARRSKSMRQQTYTNQRRLLLRSFACLRALDRAFVRLASCVCPCVPSIVRSYVLVYARRVHNVSSRSVLIANTLMAICIRSVHTFST